MKQNMGMIDRIARIALGALLIALSLTGAIGLWGWVGLVPLATATVGFCPLYRLIGIKTCATR